MDVHPARFDPAKLLDECIHIVQPLVKSDQVALSQEAAADLPPLRSDRDKVKQILLNLLGNAAKFTQAGFITASAHLRDDRLVFAVADTGIGIPENELERIFEAFHQTDVSSTRQFGGTGLGLSISLRLARLLQGGMHVTSKLAQGSTFELSLPLAYDPEQQTSEQSV